MKILSPENIFTKLFFTQLKDDTSVSVEYKPASNIIRAYFNSDADIVIIPAFDLFNLEEEENLFVSKSIGISFQAELSNIYLYFTGNEPEFKNIAIIGDFSNTEIMFSKFILQELYRVQTNIMPATEKSIGKTNCIIVGDKNFENERFLSGLNMTEQGIEILKLPFVHYLFVGRNENTILSLNDTFKEATPNIYETIEKNWIAKNYSDDTNHFFKQRIPHVKYNFTETDLEGLMQLLRYPFFFGQVDDIIDIEFV